MSRRPAASAALLALALTACGDEKSTAVPTNEIYPQLEVRTDADGNSRIGVTLLHDLFTTIRLVKGDRMVVSAGNASTVMVDSTPDAMLATGNAANTAFRFDLQRPRLADAPNSNGTLPAPMTLTAPTAGSSYTVQSDDILVRWSGSGGIDAMSAEIKATCRSFTGGKPLDVTVVESIEGDLGIASVDLSPLADRMAGNCSVYDAVFTLRRSREGTVDDAYGPPPECRRADSNCFTPTKYLVLMQVRAVPLVLNNRPS